MNNENAIEEIDLDALDQVTGGGKLWRKIVHKIERKIEKVVDKYTPDIPVES
jgi:hypothetical protein